MSTFTFTNSDGDVIEQVWSCVDCLFVSAKRHFRDGPECPLCDGDAEKLNTIEKSSGMSDFEYRQILNWLQENMGGIGPATTDAIEQTYPDGGEFVEACKHAYENGEYDELTRIDGIGESYARHKLAIGLAEMRGWEDGAAEGTQFTFSKA